MSTFVVLMRPSSPPPVPQPAQEARDVPAPDSPAEVRQDGTQERPARRARGTRQRATPAREGHKPHVRSKSR